MKWVIRVAMAKGNKQDQSRSVLKLSYEAYQRGDSVQARQLAKAVLAGKVGKDDEKVAVELAKVLSTEGAIVAETPAAVAADLVSRTITPPKPYLFVAAVAGAFIGLVILAAWRY
ncbi:MAG: hypothetical protein Q8L48_06485 [Archangium sp.]|nr:hypothetical protein [Archangium sp.]